MGHGDASEKSTGTRRQSFGTSRLPSFERVDQRSENVRHLETAVGKISRQLRNAQDYAVYQVTRSGEVLDIMKTLNGRLKRVDSALEARNALGQDSWRIQIVYNPKTTLTELCVNGEVQSTYTIFGNDKQAKTVDDYLSASSALGYFGLLDAVRGQVHHRFRDDESPSLARGPSDPRYYRRA